MHSVLQAIVYTPPGAGMVKQFFDRHPGAFEALG